MCGFFYYFSFKSDYDVLKSKGPCILLNNNTNVKKNEMETKMTNATHSFREIALCFKLIEKSQI